MREDMWLKANGQTLPHWLGVIRDGDGREATITIFDRAHHTLITNGYKRMADITRDNPVTVILGAGSTDYPYQISDVWSKQVKGWINVQTWTEQENRRVAYGINN